MLSGIANLICHCLTGLVVTASASRAEDPGSDSRLRHDFSGVESYQWLKIGTPEATLPGAWCHRVSAGTGWPGVSILWLGEMESWICNFYLSVAARKIVWADPSPRYIRMLPGTLSKQQTNLICHWDGWWSSDLISAGVAIPNSCGRENKSRPRACMHARYETDKWLPQKHTQHAQCQKWECCYIRSG